MQIGIGNKIRELRRRDGRKQEDLANALGVTCQAVSRWEANGGYPDMEMIPAIANYFNISIDELFGYSKDRDEKLKAILSKADGAIDRRGDLTECVKMLRAAADEFPSEPRVYIRLGTALDMLGWEKHGARSYTKDGSNYTFEDTEYNSRNVYWQEALRAYEKALTLELTAEERETLIRRMVLYYAKMGRFDKAAALAAGQNSLRMSREILLPLASEGETRDRYQGEAIIDILTILKSVIVDSVGTKVSVFTEKEGVAVLTELARLFETVFSDGRCGACHLHICELYLFAAVYEARFGEGGERAFEYFKRGFEHKKLYESVREQDVYQYTAPLVSKVSVSCAELPPLSRHYWWENWLGIFTDELTARIKSEPKYAECFDGYC